MRRLTLLTVKAVPPGVFSVKGSGTSVADSLVLLLYFDMPLFYKAVTSLSSTIKHFIPHSQTKVSGSRDGTPLWIEGFLTKEKAWLISGVDVVVLKKNIRPASKVLNAFRKASERTTSLQGCCGVTPRLFLLALNARYELKLCSSTRGFFMS